jgi:hypothetical protein
MAAKKKAAKKKTIRRTTLRSSKGPKLYAVRAADGNFKGCLFGPNEVNLADALRSGASDSDIIDERRSTRTAPARRTRRNGSTVISSALFDQVGARLCDRTRPIVSAALQRKKRAHAGAHWAVLR